MQWHRSIHPHSRFTHKPVTKSLQFLLCIFVSPHPLPRYMPPNQLYLSLYTMDLIVVQNIYRVSLHNFPVLKLFITVCLCPFSSYLFCPSPPHLHAKPLAEFTADHRELEETYFADNGWLKRYSWVTNISGGLQGCG